MNKLLFLVSFLLIGIGLYKIVSAHYYSHLKSGVVVKKWVDPKDLTPTEQKTQETLLEGDYFIGVKTADGSVVHVIKRRDCKTSTRLNDTIFYSDFLSRDLCVGIY